jgi:hypothetical protein
MELTVKDFLQSSRVKKLTMFGLYMDSQAP